METLVLNIVLCAFLGVIGFQDFKYRAIHFMLPVLIFASGIAYLYLSNIPFAVLGITLLFITTILMLLWLYLSLKNKKLLNPLKEHIGLGDIIFFFAITPFFGIHGYMAFFISGMIIALLVAILLFRKQAHAPIPLAGILAVYLLCLKVLSVAAQKDIFYSFNYF